MVQYKNHLIVASGKLGKLFGKGTPELEQAQFFIIKNAEQQSVPQQMNIIGFPSHISLYAHGLHLKQINEIFYLFAVNHAYQNGGERIEIFKIQDDIQLVYYNSILMDPQYTGTLKDLILISRERFLITKLMPYTDPIEGRKEWGLSMNLKNFGIMIFKRQTNYILDCKFDLNKKIISPTCTPIDSQYFAWTGGIAWDNHETVWVGDNLRKIIYEFKLQEDGLKKISNIQFPHQIDNIHYDKQNQRLLVAMTPKAYQTISLQLHLRNNELVRDSQYQMWSSVAQHSLRDNSTEIIYQSQQYSRGISGGLILGNKLYLTSWADVSPMVCTKSE